LRFTIVTAFECNWIAVRHWPKINICADCLDLAQPIFDK